MKLYKKGSMQSFVIWNRKGRLVTRFEEWMANLLTITLIRTAKRLNAPIYVKEMAHWIYRIVRRIEMRVDTTFIPNLIIGEL